MRPTPPTPQLARDWLIAAAVPAVDRALQDLHHDLARRIARRAPACWASGRCCNFASAGHELYATGLETAWLALRLAEGHPAAPALAHDRLDDARARGGCPFQRHNLCTAHDIKPAACRTYFCDRSALDWHQALTEDAHRALRRIHEDHRIAYVYAEWRDLLEAVLAAGWTPPAAPHPHLRPAPAPGATAPGHATPGRAELTITAARRST